MENGQLALEQIGENYGSPDRVVQTAVHALYQFFHQTVYNMSVVKGRKIVSLLPMPDLEQRFAEVVLDKNAICPAVLDPPYRPIPQEHTHWFVERVRALDQGHQERGDFWPFRSQNLFTAFNVVLDGGFSSSLTFYGLPADVNQPSVYEEYMEAPGEQQDFRNRIMYGGRRDVAQVAEAVRQEQENRQRVE